MANFDEVTGSPVYNDKVLAPAIGSPITAQSVREGEQTLINNDVYLKEEVDNLKSGEYARIPLINQTNTIGVYEVFRFSTGNIDDPKGIITRPNNYQFQIHKPGVWLYNLSGHFRVNKDTSRARFGLINSSGNTLFSMTLPFYDDTTPGQTRDGYFANSFVVRKNSTISLYSFGWIKPDNDPSPTTGLVMTLHRLGDL